MDQIRVVSLFSGIGAFEKALTRIGKKYEVVNFCEIDKNASKSYCAIHGEPESKNLGDISKVDETKLPDFDLMTWGFPCQDISIAGKLKGIEVGTRSGLYYEGLRILNHKKPTYSIIENVKNLVGSKFKAQFQQILDDLDAAGYNSYWKVMNAKNYGIPQSRERVFIVSVRKDADKGFEFPKEFDSGVRLKDFIEKDVPAKYTINPVKTAKFLESIDGKKIEVGGIMVSRKGEKFDRVTECANTLMARDYKGFGNHSMNAVLESIPNEISDNSLIQLGCLSGSNSQANRVYSTDGVSATLCGISGGWGAKTGLYVEQTRVRRLCPKECFRLMGFDDADYEKVVAAGIVSDTQLYKQAGNSIVVNVLECIFKSIFGN